MISKEEEQGEVEQQANLRLYILLQHPEDHNEKARHQVLNFHPQPRLPVFHHCNREPHQSNRACPLNQVAQAQL